MKALFSISVEREREREIKTNSTYIEDHHFFVVPWSCIFHVSPFFQEKIFPVFWLSVTLLGAWEALC